MQRPRRRSGASREDASSAAATQQSNRALTRRSRGTGSIDRDAGNAPSLVVLSVRRCRLRRCAQAGAADDDRRRARSREQASDRSAGAAARSGRGGQARRSGSGCGRSAVRGRRGARRRADAGGRVIRCDRDRDAGGLGARRADSDGAARFRGGAHRSRRLPLRRRNRHDATRHDPDDRPAHRRGAGGRAPADGQLGPGRSGHRPDGVHRRRLHRWTVAGHDRRVAARRHRARRRPPADTLRYAAVTAVGKRLIIAGGSLESGTASDTVYEYAPAAGHVVRLGSAPGADHSRRGRGHRLACVRDRGARGLGGNADRPDRRGRPCDAPHSTSSAGSTDPAPTSPQSQTPVGSWSPADAMRRGLSPT